MVVTKSFIWMDWPTFWKQWHIGIKNFSICRTHVWVVTWPLRKSCHSVMWGTFSLYRKTWETTGNWTRLKDCKKWWHLLSHHYKRPFVHNLHLFLLKLYIGEKLEKIFDVKNTVGELNLIFVVTCIFQHHKSACQFCYLFI